jgi:UDP-N-acetylmuramoylalanine--D-glutamate ligase
MPIPYVIAGLGQTGLSCARYFLREGITFALTDTRENPPLLDELLALAPNIPLSLGKLDPALLEQADTIVKNPGLSPLEPALLAAQQHGTPIIGDIELFARATQAPIIGITGTNAKGTVTTLVGNMAKLAGINVQVGGNIGIPALDLLPENAELYVLEISSFQLETTYSLKTAAATILNISADHGDRYVDHAAYIAAKQRIYAGTACAVIPADDQAAQPQGNWQAQPHILFGQKAPAPGMFGLLEQQGKTFLARGNECLLAVDQLKIKGQHNWLNALAALALGEAVRLPLPAMLQALQDFPGLPHRCQWIGEWHGVAWYNDSKATNIGATVAALNGLGRKGQARRIILIAGGDGKDADFSPLQQPVAETVKQLIVFGKDAERLATCLEHRTPVTRVNTLLETVMAAKALAAPGDLVLLAPACASLDMFKHYGDRGDQFVALVKEHAP